MRTGLIVFGIIFFVIGLLLYFVPQQVFSAYTTSNGNSNTNVSTARISVPVGWALAFLIIGFVIFILGLAIPDSEMKYNSKRDSYDSVVESKEDRYDSDGNKHKVISERTVSRKSIKNEDDD